MVESYVKISSGKEYVYQPCCDGYALRGKFGNPSFLELSKPGKNLWPSLVKAVKLPLMCL